MNAGRTLVRWPAGRALVVHGEPGAGKTVLLEYLAEQAGCQVVRVAGVQSEMVLAFAGLHPGVRAATPEPAPCGYHPVCATARHPIRRNPNTDGDTRGATWCPGS